MKRVRLIPLCVLAFGVTACAKEVDLEKPAALTSGQSAASPSPPLPKLRLQRNGEVLVSHRGARAQVDEKQVTGYVDSASSTGRYVDLAGWAAPADLSGPARAVVALVRNKAVAVAVPSRERRDLVEGYDKPGLVDAGFMLRIPKSSLICSRPSKGLKLFGIAGDTAASLKWLADVPTVVADSC